MSQQGERQGSVRALTGTANSYEGDFHALFTGAGIPEGPFNGRFLAWLNQSLGATYTELNGAMQAYATAFGAYNWSSLGAITPFPGALVALAFQGPVSPSLPFYQAGGVIYPSFLSLPGASYSGSVSGTGATVRTATTSSGALATFANGVPRITDLGLLVEGSATNLLLWSQDMTQAQPTGSWGYTGSSVTKNVILVPDGSMTGNKLSEDAAVDAHLLVADPIITPGQYGVSVYAKAGERSFIALYDQFLNQGKWFNLATGAIGGNLIAPPDGASIQALANGWYRCTIYVTYLSTTAAPSVFLSPDGATFNYQGVPGDGAYLWQADLQAGTSIGSPIPTASAAVTRTADTASLTYSPDGTAATVLYGTNSSASISPASPINLGASSGGAWVGGYVRRFTVVP
jgi:hypothetical protein